MTDGPVTSADDGMSSPPSHETASSETSIEPEIDFHFKRGTAEKLVVAGTKPYILLTQTDKGISILGGGLPDTVSDGVIAEFLLAAADTFHFMGTQIMEKTS